MAEALSPQALSNLIGSIYDCALDPDRWEGTLAEIMGAFEGRTAILSLIDQSLGRLLINRTVGIEPYQLEAVARHTPEICARMEEIFTAEDFSLDAPYTVSRHWRDAYDSSPYAAECLKPYGIVDVLQYFLMRTPTRFSVFGVSRHERCGVYGEPDFELGTLLLPHLRRAVTISNVLDARTIERARMAEALDALRCGVMLVNGQGAILHANRAAEGMLRAGGPLRATRGVLRAATPAAARELGEAIGLAARDAAAIGNRGLAIRLTEPEAASVFAHVLPLTGGDFRTRLQPDAAAAVFVGDTPDAGDWARAVAAAFRLTPAETRLLAALLGGRRLADAAGDLGVAATTARTHLDSIFLKTGVSRQAELMRVAMQVAPPA
jgi:DNA-binding CsgD family transcriptional regulator/PAS domain-containing protein